MPNGNVVKPSAKVEKVVLSKDNVKNFVKLSNRRDIRGTTVRRLLGILNRGGHFETPLMVNRITDKFRLVDGNHRHEAIEEYLRQHPEGKVECWTFIYDNLNVQQEREMFTKWNSGMKQTTNDFVKQYWTTMPITKSFKTDWFAYPVMHIWTANAIEFKTLLVGYMARFSPDFQGGFQGSAFDFIEAVKELGEKDAKIINAFLKEYIEIFGRPSKQNMHYRQAAFYAMFRIWLDNAPNKNPEQMRAAFQRVKGCYTVVNYFKLGGTRENVKMCAKQLLAHINGSKKNNLFVINGAAF